MTATITEDDVDLDQFHMLDSVTSKDIPCDNPEHDVPAVWKIILSCCGHVSYICQDCMDANLEAFADKRFIAMICLLCRATHVPPSKIIGLAERI